jgi:hypothetical protein
LGIEEMTPDNARKHRRHPGLLYDEAECALFALVVSALGEAQVSPEGIEVFIDTNRGLSQGAFAVFNGRSKLGVQEMLGKLKRLFLTVHSLAGAQDISPIQRFLLAATGVESLRLNMVRPHQEDSLLKWMAFLLDQGPARLAPEVSTDSKATHDSLAASKGFGSANQASSSLIQQPGLSSASRPFTNLRKLDIGFAHITRDVLFRLLTGLQLHEFSLWKIAIVVENLFTSLGNKFLTASYEEAQQVWPNFLRDLGNFIPPSSPLRTIMIGDVAAGPVEPDDISVHVGVRWSLDQDPANPEAASPGLPSLKQIKYHAQSGQSVSEWLIEVANRIDRVTAPKVWGRRPGRWFELDGRQHPLRRAMLQQFPQPPDNQHYQQNDDHEFDEMDGEEEETEEEEEAEEDDDENEDDSESEMDLDQ